MKTLILAATAAIIVSAPAFAQDGSSNRGMWNQQITRQQAQQMADAMFQRFDLNHDGTVTVKEADKAAASMGFGGDRAGRMLDRVFGDAQSLTLQQFEAQALARFDREDVNHDGIVTPEERMQARQASRAQRAGQNGGQ